MRVSNQRLRDKRQAARGSADGLLILRFCRWLAAVRSDFDLLAYRLHAVYAHLVKSASGVDWVARRARVTHCMLSFALRRQRGDMARRWLLGLPACSQDACSSDGLLASSQLFASSAKDSAGIVVSTDSDLDPAQILMMSSARSGRGYSGRPDP